MTPLDCALQRGFRSTAKYLQCHGGVPASRLGSLRPHAPLINSAISLQIRDDVTFWGETTSESDRDMEKEEKGLRKSHKRKFNYRHDKKKDLLFDTDGEIAVDSAKTEGILKTPSGKPNKGNETERTSETKPSIEPKVEAQKNENSLNYSSEITVTNKGDSVNIQHKHNGEIIFQKSADLRGKEAEKQKQSAEAALRERTAIVRPKTKEDTPDPRRKEIFEDNAVTKRQLLVELKKELIVNENKSTQYSIEKEEINETTSSLIEKKVKSVTLKNEPSTINPDQQSLTSYEEEDQKKILVEASIHEPPKEETKEDKIKGEDAQNAGEDLAQKTEQENIPPDKTLTSDSPEKPKTEDFLDESGRQSKQEEILQLKGEIEKKVAEMAAKASELASFDSPREKSDKSETDSLRRKEDSSSSPKETTKTIIEVRESENKQEEVSTSREIDSIKEDESQGTQVELKDDTLEKQGHDEQVATEAKSQVEKTEGTEIDTKAINEDEVSEKKIAEEQTSPKEENLIEEKLSPKEEKSYKDEQSPKDVKSPRKATKEEKQEVVESRKENKSLKGERSHKEDMLLKEERTQQKEARSQKHKREKSPRMDQSTKEIRSSKEERSPRDKAESREKHDKRKKREAKDNKKKSKTQSAFENAKEYDRRRRKEEKFKGGNTGGGSPSRIEEVSEKSDQSTEESGVQQDIFDSVTESERQEETRDRSRSKYEEQKKRPGGKSFDPIKPHLIKADSLILERRRKNKRGNSPETSEESKSDAEVDEDSYTSPTPSTESSITAKVHKSFTVIGGEKKMQEERRKSGRSSRSPKRKIRSRSEETRGEERLKEKYKKSRIPTSTNLRKSMSKSDRYLDKERKIHSSNESRIPSLPNLGDGRDFRLKIRPRSESNIPLPYKVLYSDYDVGSGSDVEDVTSSAKKKRWKKRAKPRGKSAGSDYDSNVIDSGFEPSPRSLKPAKWKNMSERGVNMVSVQQTIQNNIRRYHLERKLFQQLLDLKRLQIRSGQHNEAVLVKRAIDAYHKSCASTVGVGRYTSEDFTFKSFEHFLYHALRKLQKNGADHLRGLPETPTNPLFCTQSTHRCLHATHAYTGVPCAAYLPKLDHHTIPKIGFDCKPQGFLPHIATKKAVTLELSHGNDKQVISLPADRLDQNKRYYVTFTVKGHENVPLESGDLKTTSHRHARSD